MSRIGKQTINIPSGVDVQSSGSSVTVKGPKGQLSQDLIPSVHVSLDGSVLAVTVDNPDEKRERAFWGLYQRLVSNMITGVTEGFTKKLEVNGVGYRVAVSGNKITLNVGFSHPVEFVLPDGISATVEKNVITLEGIDKQLIGEVAAQIRRIRKPEPYKGKGIKYSDEVVRRKAGKQAK